MNLDDLISAATTAGPAIIPDDEADGAAFGVLIETVCAKMRAAHLTELIVADGEDARWRVVDDALSMWVHHETRVDVAVYDDDGETETSSVTWVPGASVGWLPGPEVSVPIAVNDGTSKRAALATATAWLESITKE